MIGFGDLLGLRGTHHTIGDIGLAGGIHSSAWTHSCTGITAIGTTTTIHALSALRIITTHTIVRCTTVFVVMTMQIATLSAHLLRAMLRAM